jgi:hypothetical protein
VPEEWLRRLRPQPRTCCLPPAIKPQRALGGTRAAVSWRFLHCQDIAAQIGGEPQGLSNGNSTTSESFPVLILTGVEILMSVEIRKFIDQQATRTIQNHQHQIFLHILRRKASEKRTGTTSALPISTAQRRWTLDQQFNPYRVRRKSASLSHAIEKSIKAKSYQPRPALQVPVPKLSGGRQHAKGIQTLR